MRVEYRLYDKNSEPKHIPIDEWYCDSKDRPIPRVGEKIVRHKDVSSEPSLDCKSLCGVVTDVTHIYDERVYYAEHHDMTNMVFVILEKQI